MSPHEILQALMEPVRKELNAARDARSAAEIAMAQARNREEDARDKYNALYSAMVAFEERNRG